MRRRRLGRGPRALLLAVLALLGTPAAAQEARGSAPVVDALADARLAGSVEARIELELGWPPGSFRVEARDRRVLVTVAEGSGRTRAELRRIEPIAGVRSLDLASSPDLADGPVLSGNGVARLFGLTERSERLPAGDVFEPLLADPKTPQFYASLRDLDSPGGDTTIGAVGFGETFGLLRRHGVRDGEGLQLAVAAAIFAQFDMQAESDDLLNADYLFGVPLTWRRGATSARLRAYHQSSHLGDEFLLEENPERINLSFESLELLVSQDVASLRAYLGGEWLFHVDEPEDLDRWGAHGGLEWRAGESLLGLGRPVAGLDLKSWEEHSWDVDVAFSVGLERGSDRPGERRVRWMIELYDGHAPYGQFFADEVRFVGFGVYVGF